MCYNEEDLSISLRPSSFMASLDVEYNNSLFLFNIAYIVFIAKNKFGIVQFVNRPKCFLSILLNQFKTHSVTFAFIQ